MPLDTLKFPDNSRWDPTASDTFREIPRAERLEFGWLYDPNLPIEPDVPWVPFEQWWNGRVFFRASAAPPPGVELTRKEVVDDLCHKDGGSHVDPTLPPKYAHLARVNGLEMFWSVVHETDNPNFVEMERGPIDASPYPPAVRQIAEEARMGIVRSGLLDEEWHAPGSMF